MDGRSSIIILSLSKKRNEIYYFLKEEEDILVAVLFNLRDGNFSSARAAQPNEAHCSTFEDERQIVERRDGRARENCIIYQRPGPLSTRDHVG